MNVLYRKLRRLAGRAVRMAWPDFRRPVGTGAAPNVPPQAPFPMPNVLALSQLLAPGDDKYVVFFAPEAGVVPHYIAHCIVAKSLEERGHRTLIVRCFDVYPRCVVMDGEGLPPDLTAEQRSSVCASCHKYANDMT